MVDWVSGQITSPLLVLLAHNLFLSAYRFEKPLLEVWRAALPMLVILAIGVLLITYVPRVDDGVAVAAGAVA